MLNDKDIELIRRFHEFDLSEEELVQINQRIDTDSGFKKEVEKLGLVRDTIIQLVGHEQNIKATPIFAKGKKPKGSQKNNWLLALAACLVLLICCTAYYQYASMQTKEQIFAESENFAYSISSDIMRSETPDMNVAILNEADEAALQAIIGNYKNKNFEAAEKEALLLKNTSKDMTAQEIVAWWLVNIYMQQGEIEKAKNTLEKISRQPDFNSKKTATEILGNI